jgi:cell division septation protein DedD
MPDPNNGRVYRVQVGAYSSMTGVYNAIQVIKSVGFNGFYEMSGNVYRAVLTRVPSWQMAETVQRLGAAGFREFLLREE